ncbi:MAG: recombination protein RecR [Gammaproteobacteria bacterium]|jgi:recombination protein RecR
MIESPRLAHLIETLCCLPGIGKKSAQRIAYHLLERDRDGARKLADSMKDAMDAIGHCQRCRTFSETEICQLCASSKRDRTSLCVVENPVDVSSIEQSDYKGLYFVLMGHLSPLDGIGPDEIGLHELAQLLDEGEIHEVILATNTTVEGEATAHFIGEMVRKRKLKVTRLAHGIPMGGGLEYVNSRTISHAMAGRREV